MLGVSTIEIKLNSTNMLIDFINNTLCIDDKTINVDESLLQEYIIKFSQITHDWNNKYIDRSVLDGNDWEIILKREGNVIKTYSGKGRIPNNFILLEELNNKLIREVYHV